MHCGKRFVRKVAEPGAWFDDRPRTTGGNMAGEHRRRSLPGSLAAFLALFACPPAFAQAPPTAAPHFVVVLDAAHGGDDSGAQLGNQAEKDYTLALSVKLRSLLMARGIAVVTTRESGADVDADRRAEIANRANAAACLNLHAALVYSKSGPAVHLFLSSLPSAADARFPPQRQRPVAGDPGFVPWRTAQSAWTSRSTALAGVLNSALTHAGITVTLGRTALPAIDSMACPAVAVEISPQRQTDEAGSDDAGFEAQVADALAAALVEWRANGGQSGGPQP
jgi:N-acetylmuramoyl-L-alanine amidase